MELAMDELEAGAMVAAKVGDGFVIGRELANEPDEFQVAVTFLFQLPRGAQAMEITVEIKAQERARFIGGPPGVSGDGPCKTQRVQIERGDEGIDETHRVLRCDVILNRLRQEQPLLAVGSVDMIHG